MTKAKVKTADGLVKPGDPDKLEIKATDEEPAGRTLARVTLDPITRNANLASSFGTQVFGDRQRASIMETAAVLAEEAAKITKGDMGLASRILTSQAVALDALFTEMARRSGNNMGQYPDAADRYMRLALKAQANCRATLDALAKLHQPREQTVRHVHVNEGGQAVIADQFHQHTGGRGNAEPAEQSDATGTAGERAALPCPDPLGNGVPVSGGEREASMQDARRNESRRA